MKKNNQRRRPRTLLLTFVASLSLLVPATGFIVPVGAQNRLNLDGDASGAITISDGEKTKTIKLKYAYASSPTNLYFTDKPLPEDPGLWSDYVAVMSRDGKLNALGIFTLGNVDAEALRSTVYSTACDCKDDWGLWRDIHGSGQLERKINSSQLSGKASSEAFYEHCGPEDRQITIEYEVTFKTRIAPDQYGDAALIEDKPGIAYSQFYTAVIAEDAAALRRLVASEHAKLFEGATAHKNIARLKSLIQPVGRVWSTHFYLGDKYAGLYIEGEAPGFERRPKRMFKTKLGSSTSPPPVPPPPPRAMNAPKVRGGAPKGGVRGGVPGGVPGGVRGGVPGGVPAMPPAMGKALMVLERGEWKLDWWMFFHDQHNLISNIETYKTREEAEKEIEEAYWKMDDTKPLPPGGDDPGKAYLAYCQAERAGNKKAMLNYLTGAQHDMYASPAVTIRRGATIWKEGSALEYTQIAVVGGEANEEEALLKVQGMRKGNRIIGRVMMILEDGAWKVDKEDWTIDDANTIAPLKRR